jgi:hypothetical protein
MKNDKHDVFWVYHSVLIFQKNEFLIVTDQFLMNRRNQIQQYQLQLLPCSFKTYSDPPTQFLIRNRLRKEAKSKSPRAMGKLSASPRTTSDAAGRQSAYLPYGAGIQKSNPPQKPPVLLEAIKIGRFLYKFSF